MVYKGCLLQTKWFAPMKSLIKVLSILGQIFSKAAHRSRTSKARCQNEGRKTLQKRFWRLNVEVSGSSPSTKAKTQLKCSLIVTYFYLGLGVRVANITTVFLNQLIMQNPLF